MGGRGPTELNDLVGDDQLVGLARRGQRDAAEVLVRRYLPRVYGLARRMLGNDNDAEDASQEALLRAMTALGRYSQRGTFDRWLLKITSNTCLSMLQSRRREVPTEQLDHNQPATMSDPAAQSMRDRLAAVEQMLERLPHRQRAAFVLFHYQHLSLRQVAEVLAIPEGTVRSSLHRARNRLREMITMAEKGSCR